MADRQSYDKEHYVSKNSSRVKAFTLFALISAQVGCASAEPVKFSYSSEFSLSVPVSELSGATVFAADELALKTADGQLLSGKVLSRGSEGLPDDFAMQDYPKLILGLESPKTLDQEHAQLFENSYKEIRNTYGDDDIVRKDVGAFTIYSVCGEFGCLAYVTKDGLEDHILTIHGSGITREEFTSLINGGLDADR